MPAALGSLDDPAPHARLLGHPGFTSLVTDAGGGFCRAGDWALTRFAADRTRDAEGVFLYWRDPASGVFGSLAHQPVGRPADAMAVRHETGVLSIERRDGDVESRVEVCVPPGEAAELRRVTLRNAGRGPRTLELTTLVELVLGDAAADAAHPAFSKLFVQTAHGAEGGWLLASRRRRSRDEPGRFAVHALAGPGALAWETDRARFLGRGRTPAAPRALVSRQPLSGTVGAVLDPVFSLRRSVTLAPGESAVWWMLLGAGASAEEVTALARRLVEPQAAEAAQARARAAAQERERALGLGPGEADALHELAGALVYGHPALRASEAVQRRASAAAPLPAELTFPGAAPRLLVRPDREVQDRRVAEAVRARAFWSAHGLEIPVVVLAADASRAERARAAAAAALPEAWCGAGEAVAVAAEDALAPPTRERLLAEAAGVLDGALAVPRTPAPVRGALRAWPALEAAPAPPEGEAGASGGAAEAALHFDNGTGGFRADGREYVIRLRPGPDGDPQRPPLPWVNVIAREGFGFLVSEAGASTTWSRNSREHPLTPWSNDPVSDPADEALYLRDEDAGVFWSPTPGPVPAPAPYEVRHGFGVTTFRHTSGGLEQEVVQLVPLADPVKLTRVRLRNRTDRPRRLSLFAAARLVMGSPAAASARTLVTAWSEEAGALLAHHRLSADFADAVLFAAAAGPAGAALHWTADRTAFLGRHGSPERPAALCGDAVLDGRSGAGLDPCAVLQLAFALAPGAQAECIFLLGEAPGESAAAGLVGRYRAPAAVDGALREVAASWEETLGAVRVETPSPALDLLVNGWLPYQNLSCRMWGRTAFYQSGGAFGFRDQLQDATALLPLRPAWTRAQLRLHAAHQFAEGDVLHWWHPPQERGMRTRFSDDLVWLPWAAATYARATGDEGVWSERAPFLAARALRPGEDEAYLAPRPSGETGDLFEHCARAIDRSLTRGAHGLPLMGTGDWNDGMNRVGREGRGESVWLGFFLYALLGEFAPLCAARGDATRAERYAAFREALRAALEAHAWDGDWYLRAWYDDGAPLGSAASDECRIDALAQAWAVLSGAAPAGRAGAAMDAVERHLVSDREGLIRLLAPPFDATPHDPGYIAGYLPGVRENGGQYTHAALWVVAALAELGRRERAAALLEMLTPVHHTRTPDEVQRYRLEPYVVAADVYGAPPHVGRGGWSWYTGSAGWMHRVALEWVLGVRLVGGDRLRVAPCIPAAWPGFRVRWRAADAGGVVEIVVHNGGDGGVRTAAMDGAPAPVEGGAAWIPLPRDGGTHRAEVWLGSGPSGAV